MYDSFPDFSGDDFANDKDIQRRRALEKAYERMLNDILELIKLELNAEDSSHKNFKGFLMFRSLTPIISHSLKASGPGKQLRVSLAGYFSSAPIAKYANAGTDQYLFGHLTLKSKYPRTYIHKETLKEKLEDLILKRDLDFSHSKHFSRRFQVLTENVHGLENLFQTKNLDVLTAFPDMELEFLDRTLLFRSSRKAVSIDEAKVFCELAKTITKLFG